MRASDDSGNGIQVLIVDDDPSSFPLVKLALTPGGYEVLTAGSGAEAMEILRSHARCRVVVSDVDMPGMDGITLCRTIRDEARTGYVYLILLTGQSDHDLKLAALDAGADDFLIKPFDRPELAARVRVAERILSLETRDVALVALAKLAESRDSDTGAHLERVQRYSGLLARELSKRTSYRRHIDSEYVRLIELTSALHDIGKIAIPDHVLLKNGRLSEHEFEVMKSHTTLGAKTLDAALQQFPQARYLRMARDIALTHHERFDGTGYPSRVMGPDIPLCGRIVALADVYDAVTSKRCYKSAFPHDVAQSIILNESAAHFDPDVVDAFVAAEPQFIEICRQSADRMSEAA